MIYKVEVIVELTDYSEEFTFTLWATSHSEIEEHIQTIEAYHKIKQVIITEV